MVAGVGDDTLFYSRMSVLEVRLTEHEKRIEILNQLFRKAMDDASRSRSKLHEKIDHSEEELYKKIDNVKDKMSDLTTRGLVATILVMINIIVTASFLYISLKR